MPRVLMPGRSWVIRFLIDECSVKLCALAHECGYEAYHVAHHGMAEWKDPQIFRRLTDESLVLVTNNRTDSVDLVSQTDLHAGLVVIVENVRREGQLQFFAAALNALGGGHTLPTESWRSMRRGRATFYDLPPPKR